MNESPLYLPQGRWGAVILTIIVVHITQLLEYFESEPHTLNYHNFPWYCQLYATR